MTDPIRTMLEQRITQKTFSRKYRYYASILSRLDPIENPHVQVMAVSLHGSRFYLHINVDFFLKPLTNMQFFDGVLLHEVHHIVLGHLSDPRFQGVSHPDLLSLAMEIAANEFIQEKLPGQPPRWNDYQHFGITTGQSTLERYELLVRARQQGHNVAIPACVDDHHGLLGNRQTLESDILGNMRVQRLIEQATDEVQKAGVEGGLLAGHTPGWWLEKLKDANKDPEVFMNWRAAIQMFVGLLRTPIHTYARPNRRFPSAVGIIPGRIWYPGQVDTPKLLVAIDTSGSMTIAELTEIGRQLRPLSDLVKITAVECDTHIRRVYPFQGTLEDVAGRGGTSLCPVFERDFLKAHRPDGIIYFTDGFGPFPVIDPGVRTLWVLSKPWSFPCPWGKKALLSPTSPFNMDSGPMSVKLVTTGLAPVGP